MARTKITSEQINLSVTRQTNTTNAAVSNVRIETGVGMIVGNNTADISESVTFSTPFTSRPVVVAQFAGYGSTTFNESTLDTSWGGMTFSAQGASLTGFTARARRNDGGTASSVSGYYYTWIAIGT